MADLRRGETKQLKKDQTIRREMLDEMGSEIVQDGNEPMSSGRRTDEDRSRESEIDGDERLGPKS